MENETIVDKDPEVKAPQADTQKPSIGRIVHYRSYGTPNGEFKPEPRAAIITAVHEDDVDLCVLNPTGCFFNQHVNQGTREGQWSWPPRV